jgi:hypothetical protein
MQPFELNDLTPDELSYESPQFTYTIHQIVVMLQRHDSAYSDAWKIALAGAPESAADELRNWFMERLTGALDIAGPLHPLWLCLLSAALDRVRWLSIVRGMREKPL